jgi:hypothetical protein
MNMIEIDQYAKFPVQQMDWTEERTGVVAFEKGDCLYHASSEMIPSFFPKKTCFHDTFSVQVGHIYRFEFKKELDVERFSSNEYRVMLEVYGNEYFEIEYMGEREAIRVRDEHGRVQGYKKQWVGAK